MRHFAASAAVALCAAACGQPQGSAPSTTSAEPTVVNPDRIQRVRTELPDHFEVAALPARASPAAMWGFGSGWVTHPPQCGALAEPVVDVTSTEGWSASSPGGIVYAAVFGSPQAPVTFDPALIDLCGRWTISSGHTSGVVTLGPAPPVYEAATVGMTASVTTVVEGGTETRSHADTVAAYLGDYVVVVTVVTDPGMPNPQLGVDFAADLLTKTVSALRS